MIGKRMIHISVIVCILFFLMSAVSAVEDNMTDEMASNDLDVNSSIVYESDDCLIGGESESDGCDIVEMEENDDELTSEGRFVDVSEAYEYLNAFRTQQNVWQLDYDGITKTYFNTEDTVWLKPLVRDADLEEVARIRAQEIAKDFDHLRPDGTYMNALYPSDVTYPVENLAYGYETCEEVTEAWKETDKSYSGQGHRRAMLNTNINCVGIAGYEINGITYWVQDFGYRKNLECINPDEAFSTTNNTINPEFNINLPIYASGSFTVKVNGNKLATNTIFHGKSNITIYGLTAGTYDVQLFYYGDMHYAPINKTFRVAVIDDPNPSDHYSFSYLNTLINMATSTVKLEHDYFYDSSMDSLYREGMLISKSVTIDGRGHTIDGKNLARIFYSQGFSTIKNINFKNGYSDDSGGAIYVYSVLKILNCSFANSTAGGSGGAVYGSLYYIDQSSFTNNTAGDSGGAVSGSVLFSVKQCIFVNNTAGGMGGAFYGTSEFDIDNSSFINNSAEGSGGAIFGEEILEIKDSDFINNSAEVSGGAVYGNRTLSVEHSSFTTNEADIGSAIYTQYILNATNSTFTKNKNLQVVAKVFNDINNTISTNSFVKAFKNAYNDNGVVTLKKNWTASQTILISGNNVVIDGKGYTINAKGKWKVFFIIGENVTIKNLRIINGNSQYNGGAIYSSSGLVVLNSTFMNNRAREGGVIYINSGNASLINSTFINNTASYGGVIHSNWGNIILRDSYFENNDATLYAGGVAHCACDVYIFNSTFKNSDAPYVGGAIFAYDKSNVYIRDSTFINNTCNGKGGAVYGSKEVEINNSIFINNSADECGVIYAFGDTLTIKSSTFINNSARWAGVFDVVMENIFLIDSTFINNSATNNSGGVICNYHNLFVKNCTFINNSATGSEMGTCHGGAITHHGRNLVVEDSRFIANYAGLGGAIFSAVLGRLSVINSTFEDNGASIMGGAICAANIFRYYSNSDKYDSFVRNSTFINNTADEGGAVYACVCDFNIIESTLVDNYATEGSAVYDYQGNVYVINSNLTSRRGMKNTVYGNVMLTNSQVTEIGENGEKIVKRYDIDDNPIQPKAELKANNLNILYTSSNSFVVRLTIDGKAIEGAYVSIRFNGKTYKLKTDRMGYVSLNLKAVKPKAKYEIVSSYGDVEIKNYIKIRSIIVAKNIAVKKSAKRLKIKVSLKKVDGKVLKSKTIKLKLKGKTYRMKTNRKGVATFKISKKVLKKLKVGKHTYKVSYGKDVVVKKLKVRK